MHIVSAVTCDQKGDETSCKKIGSSHLVEIKINEKRIFLAFEQGDLFNVYFILIIDQPINDES